LIGLALRFAVRNLGRHRKRTAIVGLGVVIGVGAAVVQAGLVAGIQRQMVDHLIVSEFGHVSVSPVEGQRQSVEVGPQAIPLILEPGPLIEAIRASLPGARVAPNLSVLGMAFGETASTARVGLWGIVPELESILIDDVRHRLAAAPSPLGSGSVYLGSRLAERLEAARGARITLSVFGQGRDLNTGDFEVAEVIGQGAPWQDYFVYLRLEDLQALMGVGHAVNLLKLSLDEGTRAAAAAAARLGPALKAIDPGVRVETYDESGALYIGILTAARIQAALIQLILLVAVALGVAGAQILAVHERRREIGTMMALGTSRSLIRMVFLAEGLMLALSAGAVGAVLGAGVTLLLGRIGVGVGVQAFRWMVGGTRLFPSVDPAGVVTILMEMIVVVALSGLYPAARASRLLPIVALREGPA